MDYDIKDRLFIESLLDIEFTDCFDRGILLTDSGHSFDNILFYGNEFCLFTFDIMLFSSVLMFTDDFILTILLTLCISEVCDSKYIGKLLQILIILRVFFRY